MVSLTYKEHLDVSGEGEERRMEQLFKPGKGAPWKYGRMSICSKPVDSRKSSEYGDRNGDFSRNFKD